MRPAAVARRLGVPSGPVASPWARKAPGGAPMPHGKGRRAWTRGARARISELEAELAEAGMSVEALKEMTRNPRSGDPARMSNRRKAGFGEFGERLDTYLRWYVDGRLKGFDEGGRRVYDTIAGRRRRLGYAV